MSDTLDPVKETIKETLKPPSMWKVIFINDDFTSFEFVIACLQYVFSKTEDQAGAIAIEVHQSGKGVVGQYSKDIALTKQKDAMDWAKSQEHPLQIVVEPSV